ncbi:MAG: tryptophan--tRNA ligase [Saccharofermentanales bacterium]
MNRKTVLSGMRPTGNIHLGNYFGALENWVGLQDKYNCYFFIADWHALTTGYADTSKIRDNTLQLMADYLACGLDPDKSVIFLQSDVKIHAEMHLLLSMITPLAWLERCPTYKDQIANMTDKDIMTYGFLGYPCLMSSDILIYKADYVPVGEDQVPHLEMTREIARRVNHLYHTDVFPEPAPLLTKAKVLPGTDGRKMSKSYGNTIAFSDTPQEVDAKVMSMITDPARIRKTDPGHPEICTVYSFHKIFSSDEVEEIGSMCREGRIGCVQCKRKLARKLADFHGPIHERRTELLSDTEKLTAIISEGSAKALINAEKTMKEIRRAIGIGLDDEL